MQNRPLNEELLRALAYYGAAGGTGGGGGGGVSAYNDLLGKPIISSVKYPSGVTINGTKSLQEYGIAEELQQFFNEKANQSVVLDTPILSIKNSSNNNETTITPDIGIKVTDGTDAMQIDPTGKPVFTGQALYNFIHELETLISSDVLVDVANWSANTTHVNGVDYYTNELSFTKVYVEHPDIVIKSVNNVILPTVTEREAFTLVSSTGYFHANLTTNKITAYTQVKPTSSFKISVRGAK